MGIEGTYDERFAGVRDAFAANFESRGDVGASVAVTVDGELVVDLWGGTTDTDAARDVPWERDTIVNVYSTTKTMAAICCLVLMDRGELDVAAPVARYWREFAANGKDGIATSHLLSHTAGVSGWQEPIAIADLYDWEKATSLLAAQAPWWEPGTRSGYHAITQGYLLGEVVRRITGETIGTFFASEIAGPLGADFHIGTPSECDSRIGHLIPPSTGLVAEGASPDSIAARTLKHPPLTAQESWTTEWRRAEIPAAGGHGNARSVATVHSAIACGGSVDGVHLMSEAGANRIFEEQINNNDLVLGIPVRHGLGFGLVSEDNPVSPNQRACFWGGWGGSLAVIDLDARMSFAYVMNRMGEGTVGDNRGGAVLLAALAALSD